MSRPRSNELARSGHTALGEHARANNADPPRPDDIPGGPVPQDNQPGHRADTDQDKPVEAFAARFPVGDSNRDDQALDDRKARTS